ncbi:hypothetical protein G6Z16_01930 [Clostridium perfringens]|uniref:hypothetical protein n=1 Tax=Clostridium perfringens TaxID=1502 RepID=UPI0013E2AB21|nr:hypothetical protein [Clostridium perfringens]NGT65652.1 hypothetical protein [Clostridium perfringens]
MDLDKIEFFLKQATDFLIELGQSVIERAKNNEFSEREIIRMIDNLSTIVNSMKKPNADSGKIEKIEEIIEKLKNI